MDKLYLEGDWERQKLLLNFPSYVLGISARATSGWRSDIKNAITKLSPKCHCGTDVIWKQCCRPWHFAIHPQIPQNHTCIRSNYLLANEIVHSSGTNPQASFFFSQWGTERNLWPWKEANELIRIFALILSSNWRNMCACVCAFWLLLFCFPPVIKPSFFPAIFDFYVHLCTRLNPTHLLLCKYLLCKWFVLNWVIWAAAQFCITVL